MATIRNNTLISGKLSAIIGGGVQSVSITGFKSFPDQQSLQIRPLTVISGANSSGKSTLMQPLLLIKQTIESPFDPGALLLDGPCVRLSQARQLTSRCPGAEQNRFTFKFGLASKATLSITFEAAEVLEVTRMSGDGVGGRFDFDLRRGMNAEDLRKLLPGIIRTEGHIELKGDRCFLSVLTGSPQDFTFRYFSPQVDALKNFASQIIHLPGLRGTPERTYRRTAVGGQFPGTFEVYAASIIYQWAQERNDAQIKALAKYLRDLELTWKVDAEKIDDTRVEILVGRLPAPRQGGARDVVSIADVGVGVSQVLPVLVALLVAEKGAVVYIEQPEIHLHPRAQGRLANVLIDAANRGVKVIVETHSSILLRELQTAIAMSRIAPADVAMHWCERDPQTGATAVRLAEVDANGAWGEWPVDFDEVGLASESRYLDAVMAKS